MIDLIFGRGFGAILGSVYVALILQIVPMGEWLGFLRPSWVLLIALFWSQAVPGRFGLWYAFFIGVILDVVLDQPLGMHAISLVIILYIQL